VETNKGARESRTLETRAVAAEDVGFPFAAQVARLTRQRRGRPAETVALVTSLSPAELSPRRWLAANRQGWGIENGSHQRLDVSLNDDRCRVQTPKGLLLLGRLRRVVVSLFIHWRARQPTPKHLTLTDFQAAMGAENKVKALAFLTNRRPAL